MAEIKFHCPRCGKNAGFWNTEKRVGHCFSCTSVFTRKDISGTPQGYVSEHSPLPNVCLEPVATHQAAQDYLWQRHVPESEWHTILYEPDERALYFRIWSPSSEFAPSYHRRFIDGGKLRWVVLTGTKKEHYVFGEPLDNGRVVIVEGIFDALRVGKGAVAILGSELYPTQTVWLRQFKQAIVWGDPDPAGHKLMDAAVRLLPSGGGPKVFKIPYTPEPSVWNREPGDHLDGSFLLEEVRRWLVAA